MVLAIENVIDDILMAGSGGKMKNVFAKLCNGFLNRKSVMDDEMLFINSSFLQNADDKVGILITSHVKNI